MPRNLQQLQAQYNSAAASGPRRGMMGGGPGRSQAAKGKPKNAGKTVGRLLSYLKHYKGHIAVALICMLVSTVTSLAGSYLMAPVINKLTLAVVPNAQLKMSATEKIADGIITKVMGSGTTAWDYILAAVVLFCIVY